MCRYLICFLLTSRERPSVVVMRGRIEDLIWRLDFGLRGVLDEVGVLGLMVVPGS